MVRGIWKWRGEGWGQKSSRPGLSFVLGDQDLRQARRRRIIDHCGASTDIVINLWLLSARPCVSSPHGPRIHHFLGLDIRASPHVPWQSQAAPC